ncbi:LysR family transcriptional regulator [Thalassovita mangrovi]|uniref:LysR family transcriptional regulator n=1 Tax=Thalassovita mangrovi TaxID=2692236 RepID=A0A6L8LNM4_9RHOB|nr:LysR family transcriptional regulator [Thalassovita mangrovi]MYM55272.1 LysR family transcriptional regulator [Thalassovita mangrovi]
MIANIPTDLLRTFVTVVDLGGFTRAAQSLGRTQPAVSLQIRRLEDLLHTKLIRTEGRQVSLTEAGMALSPQARQMLRLNDDIVAHFADQALEGGLRVGMPADFSHNFLVEAISRFALDNPEVRVEVECLVSKDLRDALADDRLDIAVAIAPDDTAPFLVDTATIRPFWAVGETYRGDPRDPLAIVRHPDPCEYATRMRNALRENGRKWHTTLVSRDLSGVQAAVRAGLGASALTPATLTPGMRVARDDEGFPALAPLKIGLFYKHAALSRAGHGLAQHLMYHIGEAGNPAIHKNP